MKKKLSYLIINSLKIVTLLLLVALLMLAYYSLPERIVVHFNEFDNPDDFISKSEFFYSIGITAIVFNVTLSLLSNMIHSVHPKFLTTPNRAFWMHDKDSRKNFYEIYESWFNSLAILINGFLVLCVAIFLQAYRSEIQSVSKYSWLPVVGGLLLLFWILFLPIRLRIKKHELVS